MSDKRTVQCSAVVNFTVEVENSTSQEQAEQEAIDQAEWHLENPVCDNITGCNNMMFCTWSGHDATVEIR